ncbi:hypothetical protein [Microbacterium rhizosphaerae]|uniref:DUF1453 family protein n=1 Tax=Microbacterium rhizosphaerae TaxID=1678237 RepID=A0ABZ0SP03_9MICO|nr:hypothetical protein [Microbacterium rhizosphaerae]WPR90520.1 hypothetical protein SM116_04300 [Microbacterium rhizosphaerae]
MDIQIIGNVLLALVILAVVAYRQTTWRPAIPGALMRAPLIMGVVGVFMLVQQHAVLTGLDAAVLVVELVVSLGVGAWMGAIAHFRRVPAAATAPAQFETRTGWWGLALWLVVIAVRIGIDVLASGLGAHAATTTGVILLLLAANRAARAGMIGLRLDRMRAASVRPGSSLPAAAERADA